MSQGNPTEQPVSFAIVGCGLIGKKRATALGRIAGARLRFACDLDASRASAVSALAENCEPSGRFEEVVRHPEVRAVIVSTLNASLVPIALAAVNAGKHVLIEKPGALGSAELATLSGPSSRGNVAVRIGYNHRFHPGLQKAREIVDSGVLGPLMFLRVATATAAARATTANGGPTRSSPAAAS